MDKIIALNGELVNTTSEFIEKSVLEGWGNLSQSPDITLLEYTL